MIASTPVTVKWLVKVKGCRPKSADRQQAQQVRHKNEHEDGEDIGHIFLARRACILQQQLVDEAGEELHRHLPAAGNELALHAARDEDPQHHGGDHHPQRAVCEGDIVAAYREMIGAEQRLDRKLVHRVDFAGFCCHAKPLNSLLPATKAPSLLRALHRNPVNIPEGDDDPQKEEHQQEPGLRAEEVVQDPSHQRAASNPPDQFGQNPITEAGVCIRLFIALAGPDPLGLFNLRDSLFERCNARIFADGVLPGFVFPPFPLSFPSYPEDQTTLETQKPHPSRRGPFRKGEGSSQPG
jgi:hypothetical protein